MSVKGLAAALPLNPGRGFAIMLTVLCAAAVTGNETGGGAKCLNLRGQLETCGPSEYCCNTPLHKGCRKCTDIVDQWCDTDNMTKIATFRKRFAPCAALCEKTRCERNTRALERKLSIQEAEKASLQQSLSQLNATLAQTESRYEEKTKALEGNLSTLAASNTHLQREVSELNKTLVLAGETIRHYEETAAKADDITTKWKWVALSGYGILLVVIIVQVYRCLKGRGGTGNTDLVNKCTAVPPNGQRGQCVKDFFAKLTGRRQRPGRPVQATGQPDTSHNSDQRAPLNPSTARYCQVPVSEGDRIATGGTAHNPEDTKDFMRSTLV